MADELSAVVVDDHPAVRAGVAYWLSAGVPPTMPAMGRISSPALKRSRRIIAGRNLCTRKLNAWESSILLRAACRQPKWKHFAMRSLVLLPCISNTFVWRTARSSPSPRACYPKQTRLR